MKLIIQLPCYNEEKTLAVALSHLPKKVKGFKTVEWLIINDGSRDRTVEVARKCGVHHIVSFTKNQGLARGFMAGLDACLRLGADVIVNTDADDQYNADDIPLLVAPILAGEADVVIGARPIKNISHFSPIKKLLQGFGSMTVRIASRTEVADAPSGFRALSRDAAMRMNVFNEYTYTLETIIQAGQKNMAVASVPIRVNADLRPSRLVKSIISYVKKSMTTILRIAIVYRPLKFFATIGTVLIILGVIPGVRFIWLAFTHAGPAGHTQSLILSAILVILGAQMWVMGIMGDLLSVNRKLLEDILYRVKRIEFDGVKTKK